MSGQQAMYVCLLHDVTSFVIATEFVNVRNASYPHS